MILSRYILPCCGTLGLIGCIISMIVFLQQPLRKDVCSIYILAIHTVYLVLIPFGCGKTMITAYLTSTYPNKTAIYCKITVYLHNVLLNITRSYTVLACFDRYKITSTDVNIRANRSPSKAKKFLLLVPIIWFIVPIHLIIYFDVNLLQRCAPLANYAVFLSIYSTIVTAGHLSLMIIFTLLTWYNLRRTHIRVQPVIEHRNAVIPIRKRDIQLMKMVFTEAIIYVFGKIFFPAFMIYSISTGYIQKTIDQYAIDLFLVFLTSDFLINLSPCSTFYIYYCVSTAFRKSCRQIFTRFFRFLTNLLRLQR